MVKASALRQLSKTLFYLLSVAMMMLLVVVGMSQYLILSGQDENKMTLLGRVEGEALEADNQAFLVGKLPTEVYTLQLRLCEDISGMPEPSGVIRILLDHHLIEAMDQSVKTITVQNGQLLELDCSALTADKPVQIILDRRLGSKEIIVNLIHGKINHIDWEKWALTEK